MKRTESDSLGSVLVDNSKLWGATTQRSLEMFKFQKVELMPIEIIHSLSMIKKAATKIAFKKKLISKEIFRAIEKSIDEVICEDLNDHFPLSIWQTGSGTQTNMNINEVLANRANQILGYELGKKYPVHPNDHVNIFQSTNDSFSTAIHLSIVRLTNGFLIPSMDKIICSIKNKINDFEGIIKVGRTHMQDAVPMSLSQEFSGYLFQVERCKERILSALEGLKYIAQGGTAVGTGINTYEGFDIDFASEISEITGFEFLPSRNKFALIASHDDVVHFCSSLSNFAIALNKISNDIRVLGSGPRCGIGELILPENEPGSSIMPGKINPTQCESISMICMQVIGQSSVVDIAGSLGHLELNTYKPVIAHNAIRSIFLLFRALENFNSFCLLKLDANVDNIRNHVENCLMTATALTKAVGYDEASNIAKTALKTNKSVREVASEKINGKYLDDLMDLSSMIYPKKLNDSK